jgi:hypothetical protein
MDGIDYLCTNQCMNAFQEVVIGNINNFHTKVDETRK